MNVQTKALLATTYFGPIQWYQKLCRYDHVLIEQHETFQKQTYRNRCLIATTQGIQALTVPVEAPSNLPLGDMSDREIGKVRISDHGNWRHLHWQALQSAYGDSPFFEFYADDLRPFFEPRWKFLLEFNEAIREKVCELLDIHPHVELTTEYINSDKSLPSGRFGGDLVDFRTTINPKHPGEDADFLPHRYYQVYEQKHGFLLNLSILDMLFNMGPESIIVLSK